MTYIEVDPITEVRRNREALLKKHGGIDGLHRHMDKARPELEKQGWEFMSVEEIIARKHARVTVGKQTD